MTTKINSRINVPDSRPLGDALRQILDALYDLFEATRESELLPVSKSGVSRYCPERGKTGFQVAGQFDRPGEFSQALFDFLRVQYEPEFVGTFFLNANIGLLLEALPKTPFQLGYASLVSAENQEVASFWKDDVIPCLDRLAYSIEAASAMFVVVCAGADRFSMDLVTNTLGTVGGGFSVEDVASAFTEAWVEGDGPELPTKEVHSGFVLDESLGSRIRISLWLFTEEQSARLQ